MFQENGRSDGYDSEVSAFFDRHYGLLQVHPAHQKRRNDGIWSESIPMVVVLVQSGLIVLKKDLKEILRNTNLKMIK